MIPAALWSCTWKAALLVGVAWLGSIAIRKAAASVRHFLWIAAVLSVGLLPLSQAIPSGWRDLRRAGEASARPLKPGPQAESRVASFVVDAIDSLPRRALANRWVPALWFTGLVVSLLRLLASWALLERRRRSAHPCRDAALLSQAIQSAQAIGVNRLVRILLLSAPGEMPSTFGLMRPVILLPSDCAQWTAQRLRMVLLHEMAHIRRNDWAAGIAAQVCLAIYWFHPLVWRAVRQLREESECAADDAVLAAGEDAPTYADELLRIIRSSFGTRRVSATAIAMARSNQLERRITAMLNENLDRGSLTRKAMLCTTTAALFILIPTLALQSPAQNPPGTFGGAVLDPSGAAVPSATVIATNRETRSRDMTATDLNGTYHFDGLPAGDYEFRFLKPGFADHRENALLPAPGGMIPNVRLELGSLSETINVVAHSGGDAGENTAPQRIVLGGSVQAANLIRQVKPPYPESAKAARLQGSVILEATIGADGIPNSLQVMNAHMNPDLARAAIEAVSQWRYRPTLLNGQPVEVRTNITVNFTLAN